MLQNNIRSQPGTLETSPFQRPGRATHDLLVLRYMAQKMCAHLLFLPDDTSFPSIMYIEERRHRTHRVVVYNRREIFLNRSLTFVGFISGVQEQVNPATLQELHRVDKLLVQELASNPGLLTYSSLQLSKNHWYNLVLLCDDAAHVYFKQNSTHSYASQRLAMHYYAWIRLHNGILPSGLPFFEGLARPASYMDLAGDKMVLHSTKYFTFPEIGQPPIIRQIVVRQGSSGR